MSLEKPEAKKSRGKEALLIDLEKRTNELNAKKKKRWITKEEYDIKIKKLEEERLEILTDPDLG